MCLVTTVSGSMSWCVCSCLMQINKCSLCTTIVPAVATVAAIAMLTIIFPGGQCGVCKMRPCYMFLVSMCSCLNCLLARPNLPVSMFTPRLSIILGHRTHHHSHQPPAQAGRGCEVQEVYNIISNYLGSQNDTIFLSNAFLSIDLVST